MGTGSRAREVAVLSRHKAPVLTLAVGPGGSALTGDRGGAIVVWDLGSAAARFAVAGAHAGHVTAAAWAGGCRSPAAPNAASGADAGAGAGEIFATGGQDGCVRLWDGRAGPGRGPGPPSPAASAEPHVGRDGTGAVGDISYSPCGLVVTTGADMTLRVLDPRASLRVVTTVALPDFPYCMTLVGGLGVCGCGNGAACVVDYREGSLLYALGANTAAVRTAHASRDTLVCSGDDGSAIVYEFSEE